MPRLVYEVVPLVRPAHVYVHEYPGHGELREAVEVSPGQRPDGLGVQQCRERRQKHKNKEEHEEEDRRRDEEHLPLLRIFLKRRGSLYPDPLFVLTTTIHRTPFPYPWISPKLIPD